MSPAHTIGMRLRQRAAEYREQAAEQLELAQRLTAAWSAWDVATLHSEGYISADEARALTEHLDACDAASSRADDETMHFRAQDS